MNDFTAKEQAKIKLTNLKASQETIINEIIIKEGSIKTRLNEVAKIMQQRLELLDPELSIIRVDQISSEITKLLREKGSISIAHNVNRYLDAKYRNKNLARIHETIDNLYKIGTQLECPLIEDCSNPELQDYVDRQREFKNEYDKGLTQVNKNLEKAVYTAFQKGFQLDGEKYRRQISESDFDEEVPADLKMFVNQVVEYFKDVSKAFDEIADKYEIAPPRDKATLIKHANVLKTFLIVLQPFKDSKFTGSLLHSFERQYISDLNGKHAAGNSDKFPTKLCKSCSIIDENNLNPDDYEVMVYDTTSDTHYRCMKCAGTESITRGMSRENVGDTQAVTMRKAQNVMLYLPLLGQCLFEWNRDYIQIKEDSRKEVISRFFSESAIAGKGYTVAKQVTSTNSDNSTRI